jgi:hypothetical protein
VAERLSDERLNSIASYGERVENADSEPAPSLGAGATADAQPPDTSAHIYDAIAGSAILSRRLRKRASGAARRR